MFKWLKEILYIGIYVVEWQDPLTNYWYPIEDKVYSTIYYAMKECSFNSILSGSVPNWRILRIRDGKVMFTIRKENEV